MSPRCHIVDPVDRDGGGSMNAEDLVLNFKKGMANLSKTERRRAIESVRDVIRAAAFDDAFDSAYEVERCPRCGSAAVVKKGKAGNGEQRYLCRGCGRTFGMGSGRILGTSKLPKETWMAYAECFVLMLPLRECARRCRVCLKTAYTMRHRLIERLSACSPSFKVERGCGCELDETYFPESFKGNHTKGSFTMPRPSRQRDKQVHRRGLSRERICVMTGVNDSNETFLEVTGRGALSRERAMDALRGRIATDRAAAYVGVLAELESPRTRPTTPRTAPREPSTGSTPSTRFSAPSWSRSRACRRSTSMPTSPGSGGAEPSWRPIPAPPSARSHGSSRTASAGAASATCSTWSRPTWTTGPRPPHRGGRMIAPRYTRRGEAMPSNIPATTIRIDPEVKKEATAILDELGLSMSTAVNAFLRVLVREGGIPFEMRVKTPAPDGETAS